MVFIEVTCNEDPSVVEQLVKSACVSLFPVEVEAEPHLHFGRVICWQGRMFRQVEFERGPQAMEYENRIFQTWTLPPGRARVLLGSFKGPVFITPPAADADFAARVHEGGRCGSEYTVKPFYYAEYDREA